MSEQNQNLFGFQSDSDQSLKATGGGKSFGLNQGVIVKSVEYREKNQAGEDAPSISLEMETREGGKIFYNIYSNVTVFDKDGRPRTDTNSPDYQAKYAKEFAQVKAVLTHFCTKAVPEERYRELYQKAGIDSIKKLFKFSSEGMQALVTKQVPLDVFLQYQRKIKGDNDRTFLELPANLKTDPFLAADTTGTVWEEVRENDTLKYRNSAGEFHPFERDSKFMKSVVASEQVRENSSDFAAAANAMNSTSSVQDKNWL